jgi:putative membrane protein
MKCRSFLVFTSVAFAQSLAFAMATSAVSGADRKFVAGVSQGGMFEVQLGKLAATHAHSQDILDQGTTEAHDHELVGAKLKTIATRLGLSFPAALNSDFEQKLDRLKALNGKAFDNAYLRAMEIIHAKDGAAFAKEAKTGTNTDLRSFAAETYRIVERHIGELKAVGPERN